MRYGYRVDTAGDEVVVSVSDQRGGIAEHDLERVFDLTYTAIPRTQRRRSRTETDGTIIASATTSSRIARECSYA